MSRAKVHCRFRVSYRQIVALISMRQDERYNYKKTRSVLGPEAPVCMGAVISFQCYQIALLKHGMQKRSFGGGDIATAANGWVSIFL